MRTVAFRRATIDDAQATFAVVREAAEDVLRRAGRPSVDALGLPLERVIRFRQSCVRHDPDRFWVAEAAGRIVGAAIAVLREHVWYLAALHVVPEFQSRGIGTELIRRSLGDADARTTMTVLTDAINPVSNALYLRFGMLPQESILTFGGPLDRPGGPRDDREAAAWATSRPIALPRDRADLDRLDRGSVGFRRAIDHEFWCGVPGLEGHVMQTGGEVQGYLYVSNAGAVGPAAVSAPDGVAGALAAAARFARERGADSLHVRLAGSARHGIRWLVERGFRLDGIGLMLSSKPVGRLDRYITSGADALY